MRQSDKATLDNLQRLLVQMHQVQGEPDFTLCPTRFDEDFQREFGVGDEQPERPINVNQALEDAGHKTGDFA